MRKSIIFARELRLSGEFVLKMALFFRERSHGT